MQYVKSRTPGHACSFSKPEGVHKNNLSPERNLGPYSKPELTVALPRMTSDGMKQSTLLVALERSDDVGTSPRYILDEKSYLKRKRFTETRIADLTNNPKFLKEIVTWDGTSGPGQTIPGAIFAVAATVATDPINNTPLIVGYDGETNVNYKTRKLMVMSKYVMDEVVMNNREICLSFWGMVSSGLLSNMGDAVESLFWSDLKLSLRMRTWTMVRKNEKSVSGILPVSELDRQPQAHEHLKFDDLGQIFEDGNSTVYRLGKNSALIDFAGPGRRVYQVTVSDDHSMNYPGMKKLLLMGGYLEEKGEGANKTIVNVHRPSSTTTGWFHMGRQIFGKRKRPKSLGPTPPKNNRN